MIEIYGLIDYQDRFGSKYDAIPFRSGMDKKIISNVLLNSGFVLKWLYFSEVIEYDYAFWEGKYVIYTSSEDSELHYKSYIEDVVYYLELAKAIVIPSFKHLRANNNKVSMELLRKTLFSSNLNIKSKIFGCKEEYKIKANNLHFPIIFKIHNGAMSKGVDIAYKSNDVVNFLIKYCKTLNYFLFIKDQIRRIKHTKYKTESIFRKKFILQEYIANLNGDYKVLIFHKKIYVLKREPKKRDFRASGSGIRKFTRTIPAGLLDYAFDVYKKLNVPNTSLDIGYDGNGFYLIEFQSLYFGSFTLTKSDFFWEFDGTNFNFIEGKSVLEKEYAFSIVKFIKHD